MRSFITYLLTLILAGMVEVPSASADTNRLVSWPAYPNTLYYAGNIYQNGQISRFRTRDTRLVIPSDALIEVLSVLGPNKLRKILINRPKETPSPAPAVPPPSLGSANPAPNEPINEKGDEDVYDYNQVILNDPSLAEVPKEPYFDSAEKVRQDEHVRIKPTVTDIDVGTGLQVNQENLHSQGLVGTFDGAGASYGMHVFADFYPHDRKTSQVKFVGTLDMGQFMTNSKTEVKGSEPVTQSNKNTVMRLRGKTLLTIVEYENSSLDLGVGISWEKLPFFEIISEDLGSGKLTTKSSVGYMLGGRYNKKVGLGDLIFDLGLTPVGANVQSMFQTDLSFMLKSGFSEGYGYFVALTSKYQKVLYVKECSTNNSDQCTSPKTEGFGIGPLIGLYGDF